ncbi:hypothetical protein ABZ897_47055 [Nonomuraea sp. NPDC046802]|uniref:hypothetical protein n=1 Tax=Nonomuraea sp. NPDC046802 TaxID=3154919 RepID=UPI0033E349C9
MDGASQTDTTAANPTPNLPAAPTSSRLPETRSVDRLSTPVASSGAPVLAELAAKARVTRS